MIDTMVLDVASRTRAPAAGATGGTRARGRTEATAVSFEDVLRKLDRSGQPQPQDRPAGRPVEDAAKAAREAARRASGEGRESASPEAERTGESEEAGSAGSATSSPASGAGEAILRGQAVAAGVVGHAALVGDSGAPAPAAPATAVSPGGDINPDQPSSLHEPSLIQGGSGLVVRLPVQAPERTAASEVAVAPEPEAAPSGEPTPAGASGLHGHAAAPRAGDREGAALQAPRGILVGDAGPAARHAAAGETAAHPAPDAGGSLGDGRRTQVAQDRPALREASPGVPAGADGRAAGGSGAEGMVPLSRLFEEAGLRLAGEGSAAPVRGEGGRAGARGPLTAQSVPPETVIQAPAPEGPALLEAGATSTSTQGAVMSTAPTGDLPPARHEAALHPSPQGAAFASVPAASVGDLVLKRLQQLRSPGSDEVRLELEPRELGSLKIRLELQGDGVKAQFLVERPVVQAMLERAMAELRQSLLEQGYRVDELQVALQDDGEAHGHGGERESQAGTRPASGLRLHEAVVPEVEAPGWVALAGPGRIDIRV